MLDHGGLWAIATVLGPLLLAAAMIYGIVRYRKRSAGMRAHTDAATRSLYQRGEEKERKERL